jgi:TrpR family trp operon transcriptional repressor
MNEAMRQGWQKFLSLCQEGESTQQLDELFNLFFTIEEKETLAMRILLVKELLKGAKTQREIAQDLNISIAKITRGSNALKTTSNDLKRFLSGFFS